MNARSVGIAVGLLAAAAVMGWVAIRSVAHPAGPLLLPLHDAQWIRRPAPPSLHHHDVETRRVRFARRFSLSRAPDRAPVQVRAFREASVAVNGRAVTVTGGAADLAPLLRAGANEIAVVVANDRGPPALLVHSEALAISTPEGWTAGTDDAAAMPAVRVGERVPFEASRRLPTAGRSLLATLPVFLCLMALGALMSFAPPATLTAARVRFALLGAWVVLCANNLFQIPVRVGYDAASHYDYIAFLLEHGRLPLATDGWAMFHPPLFYLIAALPAAIAAGRVDPETTVLLLRIVPMLCGLGLVETAYRAGRTAFPERHDLQIVATAVGGFLPMNVYVSQTVGNEPLSGLLTALLLCVAFAALRDPARGELRRDALRLGGLLGLALLAKTSAIVLLPALLGLVVYLGRQRGLAAAAQAGAAARLLLAATAVAGWYYARNWIRLGRPFVGGWQPGRGFDWWQDPGYRVPADFVSFGEALVRPAFSSAMGVWDALHSTVWLDGFLSLVTLRSGGPQWSHEFMLAMSLLALPFSAAAVVGTVAAFRRRSAPDGRIGVFAALCTASFIAALVAMYASVPGYSTAKGSYALGLVPCFAVLIAGGIGRLPSGRVTRAVVWGYVFAWVGFAWLAYRAH